MKDLSLHILDMAENSIEAGASRIEVSMTEETAEDRFTLRVADNGRGMKAEEKAANLYLTTKAGKRFGLGIPLLAQAAQACDGRLSISSRPGMGTTITAEFRRSHIDRKPLGDVASTMVTLICGHPGIDFMLSYSVDGSSIFSLDTAKLKEALGGVPVNLPAVLRLIREDINEGLRRIKG
jgi:anti-sigma regulatory factor (Ser/Thr protein kinase)